jgi:transposase, IS5 family
MWQENPYYQYLAGEATFQWGQPCAASDLVHFRHRLGEDGIGRLFALSIALHKDKGQ